MIRERIITNAHSMKPSKALHVFSVLAGWAGVIAIALAIIATANAGTSTFVWGGFTGAHLFLCGIAFLLIAIWVQIATIHHMVLEKRGEII